MSQVKDEVIKYLWHVGDDFAPEDESQNTSPECEGQGEPGFCPDHENCGICRFEYMKKHGWLSQPLNLEVGGNVKP